MIFIKHHNKMGCCVHYRLCMVCYQKFPQSEIYNHFWIGHIKNRDGYKHYDKMPSKEICEILIKQISDDRLFCRTQRYKFKESESCKQKRIEEERKRRVEKEKEQKEYEYEHQRRKREKEEQERYQTAPLYRKHPDGTTDGMRYDYLLRNGMMSR